MHDVSFNITYPRQVVFTQSIIAVRGPISDFLLKFLIVTRKHDNNKNNNNNNNGVRHVDERDRAGQYMVNKNLTI